MSSVVKKSFVSNLALVIAVNFLVKPVYIFGIDRGVQNQVGASEYGLYFALFNFVYLFQILNDFGIQNFNHSVFSKYDILIPKYLPKILGTKLILAIVFIIITLLACLIVGYGRVIWPLLAVIILNQILASLLLYLRTTLSAMGHFELDSLLSVSDKLLMIALVGFLLIQAPLGPVTIIQFISCQTISFTLSTGISFLLIKNIATVKMTAIKIDLPFTIALLRKSFPYAMVLLLMTMYTRMDGIMIERLLPNGTTEAGIYAASYRILDAFGMVGVLFAGLLLPTYAKKIRRKDSIRSLAYMAHGLLLSFAITIIAISLVYHEEIIGILYHDVTPYWSAVYQILMISYFGISLSYIYGTLLTAQENIRIMNKIFLGGVLMNLLLNLYFIYLWQAWGAALATVITQSLVAIGLTVVAHRKQSMPFLLNNWLRIGLFALTVLGFTWWSQTWSSPALLNGVLAATAGLLGAIVFGIVRPKQLIGLSDLTE